MRFITYQSQNGPKLGALVGDQVIDLQKAYQGEGTFPADMIALLSEEEAGLAKAAQAIETAKSSLDEYSQPVGDITFLPPVTNPGKVIALGRNYAAHAAEGGAEPPKYPMLFHKTAGSLLGHGGTIVIPPVTTKVDYECELAVVIGRTCKQVSEEEAMDYVAGYTLANDVSARDLQRRTTQFTAGKMLDTFGPLGPTLITKDEISDPGDLHIQTRLNGNVMQDGYTKMMIFSVPFTISYISQIATLEVGDVIMTGTPEGVGYARNPPVFLKDGDVVEIEIDGMGVLSNPVSEL